MFEPASAVVWRSIEHAPKSEPVWLFSEEFIDDDFNPSGVVDGFWNEDTGWTIWRWNGCQDCYDTVVGVEPTHYALKVRPGE